MLDLTLLLTTVFSIFPVMLIGYFMRKAGLFQAASLRSVSDVILFLAQPFLIISSIATVEYSPENLRSGLTVVVLAAGAHVLLSVIAFAVTRPFKQRDQRIPASSRPPHNWTVSATIPILLYFWPSFSQRSCLR